MLYPIDANCAPYSAMAADIDNSSVSGHFKNIHSKLGDWKCLIDFSPIE